MKNTPSLPQRTLALTTAISLMASQAFAVSIHENITEYETLPWLKSNGRLSPVMHIASKPAYHANQAVASVFDNDKTYKDIKNPLPARPQPFLETAERAARKPKAAPADNDFLYHVAACGKYHQPVLLPPMDLAQKPDDVKIQPALAKSDNDAEFRLAALMEPEQPTLPFPQLAKPLYVQPLPVLAKFDNDASYDLAALAEPPHHIPAFPPLAKPEAAKTLPVLAKSDNDAEFRLAALMEPEQPTLPFPQLAKPLYIQPQPELAKFDNDATFLLAANAEPSSPVPAFPVIEKPEIATRQLAAPQQAEDAKPAEIAKINETPDLSAMLRLFLPHLYESEPVADALATADMTHDAATTGEATAEQLPWLTAGLTTEPVPARPAGKVVYSLPIGPEPMKLAAVMADMPLPSKPKAPEAFVARLEPVKVEATFEDAQIVTVVEPEQQKAAPVKAIKTAKAKPTAAAKQAAKTKPKTTHEEEQVFASMEAVGEGDLGEMRGAFIEFGSGIVIDFGLVTQTSIDGEIVRQLEISADTLNKLDQGELQQLIQVSQENINVKALGIDNLPDILTVIQNSRDAAQVRQLNVINLDVQNLQQFRNQALVPIMNFQNVMGNQ